MSQSRENLWTDERTEGWMEGQILFYRTLAAEAGGRTSSIIGSIVKHVI